LLARRLDTFKATQCRADFFQKMHASTRNALCSYKDVEKTWIPAVWLEIFGPVSRGFPAEAGLRDPWISGSNRPPRNRAGPLLIAGALPALQLARKISPAGDQF